MAQKVTTYLDDDLYNVVCEKSERLDQSKSEVINRYVRRGTKGEQPTFADTLFPVVGQSLFISGFVLAFFVTLSVGVGTSFLGLAMLIGAKSDEYAKRHDVDRRTAFIRVLGA